MDHVLYGYGGCSTCRKACKHLDELGITYQWVDLVDHPPSVRDLRDMQRRSGLPLRRFFNTAGQSYRQGAFKSRIDSMSELESLQALSDDGKLIKRPILDLGRTVLVGFKPGEWESALAGGPA